MQTDTFNLNPKDCINSFAKYINNIDKYQHYQIDYASQLGSTAKLIDESKNKYEIIANKNIECDTIDSIFFHIDNHHNLLTQTEYLKRNQNLKATFNPAINSVINYLSDGNSLKLANNWLEDNGWITYTINTQNSSFYENKYLQIIITKPETIYIDKDSPDINTQMHIHEKILKTYVFDCRTKKTGTKIYSNQYQNSNSKTTNYEADIMDNLFLNGYIKDYLQKKWPFIKDITKSLYNLNTSICPSENVCHKYMNKDPKLDPNKPYLNQRIKSILWSDIFKSHNLKELFKNNSFKITKKYYKYNINDIVILNYLNKWASPALFNKMENLIDKAANTEPNQQVIAFYHEQPFNRTGSKRWLASIIADTYTYYFLNTKKTFNKNNDEDDHNFETYSLLNDLFNMQIELRRKIDFVGNGLNKLRQKHESIIGDYNKLLNKRNHIPNNIKLSSWMKPYKEFNKTSSPLTLLTTRNEIINEGQTMHNCVGGYTKMVKQGKCIILHWQNKDFLATIEVDHYKNSKNDIIKQWFSYLDRHLTSQQKEKIVKEFKTKINNIKVAKHTIG